MGEFLTPPDDGRDSALTLLRSERKEGTGLCSQKLRSVMKGNAACPCAAS